MCNLLRIVQFKFLFNVRFCDFDQKLSVCLLCVFVCVFLCVFQGTCLCRCVLVCNGCVCVACLNLRMREIGEKKTKINEGLFEEVALKNKKLST